MNDKNKTQNMNSQQFVLGTSAAALVLLTLDAVWLALHSGFYAEFFKRVQGGAPLSIQWLPAILVYVITPLVLLALAVQPSASVGEAAFRGAVFGFGAYALYELTSAASLSAWTTRMVIEDIAWGTALCAASASAGFMATTLL
jgi:uncharacterized membrane protein